MKNTIVTLIAVLVTSLSYGQNASDFFSKSDAFFRTYVSNGKVAYEEIKGDPTQLYELTQMAETINVEEDDEYQAFWINGYNLLVIKSVIENYPLKTPLDKAGFFDKTKHSIGGKSITLNDIENKLLRAKYPKEARFHFVLVCGGLGCPPIIGEAYMPATLEAQLERQTKLAMNNPDFIRVNKNKVKISQIFEWYKADFEHEGKVIDFINKYKSEKLPAKAKVSYYPYDWTLNKV